MKKYDISAEDAMLLHYEKTANGWQPKNEIGRPCKQYIYTGKPFSVPTPTAEYYGRKVKTGESHTLKEWCEIIGIPPNTLRNRIWRCAGGVKGNTEEAKQAGFNEAIRKPLDLKISEGIKYMIEWELKGTDESFKGLNWDSTVEETGSNEGI
jgi:hypothetical protein